MQCFKCKKEVSFNTKICPECGFNLEQGKKIFIGSWVFIILFVIFSIGGCVNDLVDETETSKTIVTQEDIQQANDFIVTLEAAGLVKEIKNKCADGLTGCYRVLVDEHLWNNVANYETKQNLIYACDIYFSSQKPYKFFEGIGYKSGKKLFDAWGIKN